MRGERHNKKVWEKVVFLGLSFLAYFNEINELKAIFDIRGSVKPPSNIDTIEDALK